jgi:glutamine amidotransferase
MIGVVDYGVGNIQAFLNLFRRIGFDARRVDSSPGLEDVDRLVLPGVGHFDHAMQRLTESGLRARLEELVFGRKVPVMGVCVGMQMLSEGSDEGSLPGLGWVPGRVRAFRTVPSCAALPLPHMGWNVLHAESSSLLFSRGFDDAPQFYFLHSFFFDAACAEDVAATATYGVTFNAVVSRGHIHGVQCHPEKSHHWGEQLLKNFVDL